MDSVDPMDARRCSATARSGERCKRRPIPGGAVCVMHGGAAPQVRAKAAERLAALADPVAAVLVRLALHAESESVQLAACRDVLDRAGLGARQMVDTEVTTHDGGGDLDAEIDRLLAAMGRPGGDDGEQASDG